MSWTYDPTQLANNKIMQIRLSIGDVYSEDPLLQDEEILFRLTETSDNIIRAKLLCVKDAISRISSLPEYSLGPYSEKHTEQLNQLRALQSSLEKESIATNSPIALPPTTDPIFYYGVTGAN